MCDPKMLLGAQGAGVGVEAIGGYFAAKAQKSALQGQAAVEQANARVSELSAKTTLLAGQRAEQQSRLSTASLKATQRNNIAANGFDLNSDSARAILLSTDIFGEIDANTIASDAISRAWGYRTEAAGYTSSAMMKTAESKAIKPWMSAGATLLTGAGKVATNKYLLTKYGAIG